MRPQLGHSNRTRVGRNSTCASRKNSVTPQIMITTDTMHSNVPGSVMSPNPVVVRVVTVKLG